MICLNLLLIVLVFCKQIVRKSDKISKGSLLYFNKTVSKLYNQYIGCSNGVVKHCNKHELLNCYNNHPENNFENTA